MTAGANWPLPPSSRRRREIRYSEHFAMLRTQKGRDISWAKSRAEEAYAILLFAKHAGIGDDSMR